MSTFEFVTILLSIVVGLGVTRLLGGFGRAIEIRGQLKVYWVQVIWSINVALALLNFWWVVVFNYAGLETWLFINFAHLFSYAVLLYLQAVLILPSTLEPGMDLEAHFFSVRPWFFFFGVAVFLFDLLDTLMHGVENLLGIGLAYYLMMGSGILGAVIAMRTSNRRFHGAWCLAYLVGMISWTLGRFWSIR